MKKILILVVVALMVLTITAVPVVAVAEGTATDSTASPVFIDLTGIVIAVIGLIFNFLLAWLGKKVVPPLKQWLEEKTNTEQRNAMWDVIVKLVEAAEQVIGAGKGAEKLQYVKNALHTAGYDVDYDLIEAAVKEMNDKVLEVVEDGFALDEETGQESEQETEAEETTE